MNCPPDIAKIIAELLHQGLVRIRAFCRPGCEQRCFVETDHLHNLPHILNDYKIERLQYYWNIERPSFLRKVPANETRDLEPLWDELETWLELHEVIKRRETIGVG